MPRNQNALAIVNAAFNFKLNCDNIIEDARIVYGNISSTFVHASKTEQFLMGKNVYDNCVLQEAVKVLSEEVLPVDNPPEPSPECRKKLAIGLFYKVGTLFTLPVRWWLSLIVGLFRSSKSRSRLWG